jgi:predicted enzyme related to lactoylglutathione lyase
MKKVTGIGGIFFKSKDTESLREWYKKNLGLDAGQYGANIEWEQPGEKVSKGSTVWNPFKETTEYFKPSEKDFMINYRVEDLEALHEELKAEGVTIVGELQSFSYGKFLHIMDPEGNKIELWEPV